MAPVATHIRAGRLRAVAVTGGTRSAAFADVPTIAEAGVPGYEFNAWTALLGPAGIADQRAAETLRLHLLEIARDGVARDVAVEPPPVSADPGGRRRTGPEVVERIGAGNRGAGGGWRHSQKMVEATLWRDGKGIHEPTRCANYSFC